MSPEQEHWLCGQIEAVRILGCAVRDALHTNKATAAAAELSGVEYACNRAIAALQKAAEAEEGK